MSFFDLPPIIERMLLVSDKISDLNFSVGQLPQVEINGKLTPVQPLGLQKLTPYQTEIIALTLLQDNAEAAERLLNTGTADLIYSLPSRARFRCNIFQQRCVYSIVMRVIPTDIPTLSFLNLPSQLSEIAELRNGLVLLTGPTGSGKSSTLAAIIDIINESKHYHVVAIEDPIEYLHTHKNSTINQREVGHDTKDFPSALRAALRQAPKVILIGEMRDFDTVIKDLIERNIVTVEDGLGFATNQNNLLLSLKGLTSGEDYVRAQSENLIANNQREHYPAAFTLND